MAKERVCKRCGAVLSKKAKRCPECRAKVKKPFYKKWWVWILILALLGSCGGKDEEPDRRGDNFGSKGNASISGNASETPDKSEKFEEPEEVEDTDTEPPGFELVAGEIGEYGEPFTLNGESYIVFRVPSGTYTVTNTGKYMGQFNVYSDETHITDAGWEEPAETVCILLLDVGASGTATIGEGQYIEIHEPDKFTLVYAGPAPEEDPIEAEPTSADISVEAPPVIEETPAYEEPVYDEPVGTDYVLNINPDSMKFHYSWCDSVDRMAEKNKAFHTGTRDEVIAKGYKPCKNCNP